RHAFGQITALDFDLADLRAREGGADFFLDEFGGRLANQHAVVAADVVDDGFIELVAADAHGAFVDHPAQRDHGDLGRAAADIHHHRTAGVRDSQASADGSGHGFFDE